MHDGALTAGSRHFHQSITILCVHMTIPLRVMFAAIDRISRRNGTPRYDPLLLTKLLMLWTYSVVTFI
jgi:hypothetical protein